MSYSGQTYVDKLVPVTENPNGTLNYPDGTVMSVQPDGSVQTRVNGTNGAYELMTVSSDGKFYQFSGTGTMYLFSRG